MSKTTGESRGHGRVGDDSVGTEKNLELRTVTVLSGKVLEVTTGKESVFGCHRRVH